MPKQLCFILLFKIPYSESCLEVVEFSSLKVNTLIFLERAGGDLLARSQTFLPVLNSQELIHMKTLVPANNALQNACTPYLEPLCLKRVLCSG